MRLLLRSEAIEDDGYYGEDYVREPEGYRRREGIGIYEHLAELHEEDIGKGQGDAGSDVPSYASSALLRRQGHTHDGQDEC